MSPHFSYRESSSLWKRLVVKKTLHNAIVRRTPYTILLMGPVLPGHRRTGTGSSTNYGALDSSLHMKIARVGHDAMASRYW